MTEDFKGKIEDFRYYKGYVPVWIRRSIAANRPSLLRRFLRWWYCQLNPARLEGNIWIQLFQRSGTE